MAKFFKKKWVFLVLMAMLFFLWWSLSSQQEVHYLEEVVRRGDIHQSVYASGEVTAMRLVNIGAQVSGQVEKFYVHLGQEVKKGDLIAEIDSTTQRNEWNSAQSKLKTYQAQLHSKKIALRIAQQNYQREKELWEKDATSRRELENAENNLSMAKAAVVELNATISQAKISLSTAKANLGYTQILAPLSGTVVSVAIEEGQTIISAQASPTIAQIADLKTMIIKMQIAEGDVTKVKKGMKVLFNILSEPNKKREAILQSVDPGLTLLSQGNYTNKTDLSGSAIYYFARAKVENHDGALHIGMTTQNEIILQEAKDVLLLPNLAIHVREQNKYVRMLNAQNKVIEKTIVTGIANEIYTEVISGLFENDKVITSQANSANTN